MPRPILKLKQPSKRFAKPERTESKRPTGVECLALLAKEYPDLFRPDDPMPLAIGIHADMRADCGLSGAKIRRGLRTWTGSREYLLSLAEGGNRFDINGNVAGEISDAAIEGAREKLAMFDSENSDE